MFAGISDDPYGNRRRYYGGGGSEGVRKMSVDYFGAPAQPGGEGGGGQGGSFQAQTNPALDALLGRYGKHLDALESGGGRAMDIAAGKLRDSREGGRRALQQSEGFRGVGSSRRLGEYDAATQRGMAGAIADVTLGREAQLTGAIQGGLGLARAPQELALAEKQFGLNAANQQQVAQQQSFNQLLALLNATRTSPIYMG